jgi:hypothetical protein
MKAVVRSRPCTISDRGGRGQLLVKAVATISDITSARKKIILERTRRWDRLERYMTRLLADTRDPWIRIRMARAGNTYRAENDIWGISVLNRQELKNLFATR